MFVAQNKHTMNTKVTEGYWETDKSMFATGQVNTKVTWMSSGCDKMC